MRGLDEHHAQGAELSVTERTVAGLAVVVVPTVPIAHGWML
jgi:hypothetical protein